MKRLFVLGLLMVPAAGFALETSDCETIGHWRSKNELQSVEMYDDCIQRHEAAGDTEQSNECDARPRTPDEYNQLMDQLWGEVFEYDVLIKCPISDVRLAHKNADKNFGPDGKFIKDNGDEIDLGGLIADTDSVYYAHVASSVVRGDKEAWYVIGPITDDGSYLSVVQ